MQNEKIMLSVLVTFCRQKEYVRDNIDSILNQHTSYKYEIIVGIDGEDDGTIALLEEYIAKNNNIRMYKLSSDSRLLSLSRASENRMFLLSKAVGKYFCVIDGDDFFVTENRFDEGISFLEKHEEYIGHVCNTLVYENGSDINIDIDNYRVMDIDRNYILNNYLHTSSFIYRNIFYTDNVQFINKWYFNDTTLTLFMISRGRACFSSKNCFAYRVGVDSIYTSQSRIRKKAMHIVGCAINREITGLNEFYNGRIANNLLSILHNCRKFNEDTEFKKCLFYQKIPYLYDLIAVSKKSYVEKIWVYLKLYVWCLYHKCKISK